MPGTCYPRGSSLPNFGGESTFVGNPNFGGDPHWYDSLPCIFFEHFANFGRESLDFGGETLAGNLLTLEGNLLQELCQ